MIRPVIAAVAGFSVTAARAAEAGASGSGLHALWGLAVVIAMIAGAGWLLRRMARPGSGGGGFLRAVASVALGPRERIVVVEVGEVWLVLGVTAQNISSLHTLPRGSLQAGDPAGAGGFAGLLARARGSREPR